MYNRSAISRLVMYIEGLNGIGDKNKLAEAVKNEFNLIQDRKVYYCDDFAIRFSKSESRRMSNTVLSLSALQKYDDVPFIVCIVSSKINYLMLANSTFLKKISHSSLELRIDNIKGSFNGGDIMHEYQSLDNNPSNFEQMYAYHAGLSFNDNLERLVDSTNGIVGRIPKFVIDPYTRERIYDSVSRAESFLRSPEYKDLSDDLDNRAYKVQTEIAIAAFIDNVNLRGRIIEYLITDNGSTLKMQIIDALNHRRPLPGFKTEDKLGDYSKRYSDYYTETDIKTKVLFLDGNPKAYNIDKLFEFLSARDSVYMIYLLGVDEDGHLVSRLCSVFDSRLIEATNIQHHWAGRNTRGVTQFVGSALRDILLSNEPTGINKNIAYDFLDVLMSR